MRYELVLEVRATDGAVLVVVDGLAEGCLLVGAEDGRSSVFGRFPSQGKSPAFDLFG